MNRRRYPSSYLPLMVGVLLFCSYLSVQAADSKVQTIAKRLVVKINPVGGASVGGGIIFGQRGGYLFIATANHVVQQGVESVELEMYRNVPIPAHSFYNDKELDLALLRVNLRDPYLSDFSVHQLPLKDIGYAEAVPGMQVFPIGHPYGDLWDLPSDMGIIKSVVGSNFEFKFRCEPGHSGGGIFNKSGDLVGMNLRKATPYICRALKFTTIAKVLKNQGVALQLANRDEIILPDFSNGLERDARKFLELACEPHPCIRVQTQFETSENVKKGRIIRTAPGKGSKVRRGNPVTIVVSRGPAPLEYPRNPNGRSKGLSRFIFAESTHYRGFLVVMNDQEALFRNRNVREAVDYLLPYQSLQKVVGDPPSSSPMPGYKKRPTDARRYMAEAGYLHGNYSVDLLVGRNLTFYEQWGKIISEALKNVGLRVVVKPLNSNEVVRRVKSGNFEMALVQGVRFCPQCYTDDKETVKIVNVDCLQGYKLRVKIRIESEGGIKNYVVGTTWGPGRVEKSFISPYPKIIEETVILDKKIKSDPQRKQLQVGLWVKTAESKFNPANFAFEPNGKCPGH